MTGEGFEPFADFWDTLMGEEGNLFHRHLICPALLRALGAVSGLRVLDVACGNGLVSRALARNGALVTGIDVSPSLVERSRAYEAEKSLGIEYEIADAADIPLPDASFDRVSANMALMDIQNGAETIAEASRLLKPGGRFVASFFHPCFQVPDGSSWLIERAELDDHISRRVWRYLEPFAAEGIAARDQPVPHTYFHRPLKWYADRLSQCGMLIDTIDEPVPDATFAEEQPESYVRLSTIPFVIVLGARKVD